MALFSRKPKKTEPLVDAQRVESDIQARFWAIRNLTPAALSRYIDDFDSGYLRNLALVMQKIEDRDDMLKAVAPKRKKGTSRHGWEITSFDESPAAARQKEVAERFIGSLTSVSAVDEDDKGGIKHLIRSIMDAVGMKYSACEIVWQPRPDILSAQFRHVPLWYFEHRSNRLRFLANNSATEGVDLEPGEWLVVKGDGLNVACSILYMFKHMPLRDWVIYCEHSATPGMHGKTDAAKGSDEWNNLVTALTSFGIDWKLVTNKGAEIDPIDISASGELPWPKLVERCDRMMSVLYCGGDLASLSGKDSIGASIQREEKAELEQDDAELVEEALNKQVLPYVMHYTLGTPELKVRLNILCPRRQDAKIEIITDKFLISHGVPIAKADLAERYNRALPDEGEDLAVAPVRNTPALPTANSLPLANALQTASRRRAEAVQAQLIDAAVDAAVLAQRNDVRPLAERLYAVLELEDIANMYVALNQLRKDLPGLVPDLLDRPELAEVLENAMGAGLLNGWAEGIATRAAEGNAS